MYYSSNKDVSKLVKSLVGNGWSYSRRKKHGMLRSPSGEVITLSLTPSSDESYQNLKKVVKRFLN
ncbi:hypothetical protein SAMN03080615_00977 [Amphritea atlantica]|uniref:HicA toxin of toxin-antitoxin n=1 Tax=Amphritea atlantica TaxID=355243 RepID=A0A1H9EMM6_9GAMM|nr:hypothetical protein SAMN03080615_00977 [Amphritea atlantica]